MNALAENERQLLLVRSRIELFESEIKKLRGKLDQHIYQNDETEEPKEKKLLNNPMFSIG